MKPVFLLTVLPLALGLTATGHLCAQTAAPKTAKEKLSYAIGMDVADNLKSNGLDLDGVYLASGIKDLYLGGQTLMTKEEATAAVNAFKAEMRAKQMAALPKEQQEAMAKAQAAAEAGKAAEPENRKKAAAFLAANKTKPGVIALPDGMQYKIITEGTGPMPTAADSVTVKYRGTLIDGTEFDASEKHGGTATFPVGGVIKGWTEALQKMKTGAKWQLFIPSDLAYGERGTPDGSIAPGATLIFDVELISINK